MIRSWRNDLKRWLEVPSKTDGQAVYAASRHHQVQALKSDDGSTLWSRDLSDKIVESPKLLADHTLLIRGDDESSGSLFGLDRDSGATKWTRTFSPTWKYDDLKTNAGPLVLRRDPLAGTQAEPMLTALDPNNGEELWRVKAEGASWGVPVADGKGRLFVEQRGSERQSVAAVDVLTGALLWDHPVELWGQPRPMDDTVLLPSRSGVSVRDSVSGELGWKHDRELSHEPWLTEQAVVLGSSREGGSNLTGLDPHNGERLWEVETDYLSGVYQGPSGQVLYQDESFEGGRLQAIDGVNGESLWQIKLGRARVEGLGSDAEGRLAVVLGLGRRRQVLVLDQGRLLWQAPVEGKSVAVSGNSEVTALLDSTGLTLVDAQSGQLREKLSPDSPLMNFDGQVTPEGWMTLSGIDGEVMGVQLPGAQSVVAPTVRTPGTLRHYRYDILENDEGQVYADVQVDGQFVAGEDALLVHGAVDEGSVPASVSDRQLTDWDSDINGYLSRQEMAQADLTLWWDRDLDGVVSRLDGVVAMRAEGHRQAVVDLDRQKLEVRTRPIRA